MKKLALIIAVAGIVGLSSCKKCYTCSVSGSTSNVEYCSDSYTSTQLSILETACKAGGGEWK